MSLFKFLKLAMMMTLVAVMYIHMQMRIIDLAYQGKEKEKIIRSLTEENSNITYTVLKMKSANHLGVKLLADGSDMRFVDPDDIVRIETPDTLQHQVDRKPKSNRLLSLLSFGRQAEARSQK